MNWTQVTNPFNNLALSVLVAALPIAFIFWALIVKKMKGYAASLIATAIAILIAVFIYGMPVSLAFLSTANGALYGLFPIGWIVVTAVFLFNITIKSGQFEVIKHSIASITSDRRLQALLIAFSFGAFLEGTAGFGAPVAITAAMLVGLGFNPLYASGICLIANTAPVAFGSVGIPITVAAQVSSIPEMAISQMVGRTLPFLSFIIPLYLIVLMAGFKKAKEILPAIMVSGLSFSLLQWSSSNYLGPALPDIIAGLGSIIALVVFLKFWKPINTWRFKDEPAAANYGTETYSTNQIIRAWSPFIILTIMIIAWGLQPVKDLFNFIGLVQFEFPGLHNVILDKTGKAIAHIYRLNWLSAAGTAILFSAIIAIPLLGLKAKAGVEIFVETLKQLKIPLITIGSVLAFAYIANDSGITNTIAEVLANTGFFFPFFSPVLGWLGVFITGSDTSANALFGKLQATTATSIGVDPVVTVSANASGGVVGKMISPQSIAVAAAGGNLVGKESELFRFTVKHSFIMLLLICAIVLGQAYWFTWAIPTYQIVATNAATVIQDFSKAYLYLSILAFLILAFFITIKWMTKKTAKANEAKFVK